MKLYSQSLWDLACIGSLVQEKHDSHSLLMFHPKDEIKMVRVTMASPLLQNLEQVQHHGWRYILTGDESWLFCPSDCERMWLPEGVMPQSRSRTIMSSSEVIVSIFWSPFDCPVITALPLRAKCKADYFYGDIIPEIVNGMPFDLATSPRKLMLHMDNASPHRALESITCLDRFRIRTIDHPPCSPTLAPSDVYLFGKLKWALAGQEFDSTEPFLSAMRGITHSTGRGELESVFDAWERGLSQCIQMGGDYVT
jgi:histone-lysine N-methyltransferase SETMAR